MYYHFLFFFVASGFAFNALSETKEFGEPQFLEYHDKQSEIIVDQIKRHTQDEMKKLNIKTRSTYSPFLQKDRERLLKRLREECFLKSDSIESSLISIVNKIINANQLDIENPIVLINVEPYANARTHLNGVFEISLGLLSIIENEDQLAFVLAHEIAHRIKYHGADRIYEFKESDIQRDIVKEFSKISRGSGTLQGLEEIQNKSYDFFSNSRHQEIEADSLGIQYMLKAKYDKRQAAKVLSGLGLRYLHSENPVKPLIFQLFRESFLPKPYLFEKRLNIYKQVPDNIFVFNRDSIATHPDLILRQNLLLNDMIEVVAPITLQTVLNSELFFGLINGAYKAEYYDICLFLALYGLQLDLNYSYCVTTISKILYELNQAIYDNSATNNFYLYVNNYTPDYDDNLRMVNTFLHNLTREELAEIGYQFLNHPKNFNRDLEDHYWLLSKFCELTDRTNVFNKIRLTYLDKFPHGIYIDELSK